MNYSLTVPPEPDGPVWDVEGVAYHRDVDSMWGAEGYRNRFTWRELLAKVGPVTDVAPLDPDVGRLYAVTKDDEPDKTYVCVLPIGEEDRMYVVLPPENYDTSISLTDIDTCEPVAVVPQWSVGKVPEEFNWVVDNERLQPGVVKDLDLAGKYGSGK